MTKNLGVFKNDSSTMLFELRVVLIDGSFSVLPLYFPETIFLVNFFVIDYNPK
jgi:hypothetical protein